MKYKSSLIKMLKEQV